jgi:hypothetical protein
VLCRPSSAWSDGAKFSPDEIIATPVLMDVYDANDLKRYGDFSDFASRDILRCDQIAAEDLSHRHGYTPLARRPDSR